MAKIPLKINKERRIGTNNCIQFCVLFWRRVRDSNPRGLAPKRFSRPPRYDRFDNSPLLFILNCFLERKPLHGLLLRVTPQDLRPRHALVMTASITLHYSRLFYLYRAAFTRHDIFYNIFIFFASIFQHIFSKSEYFINFTSDFENNSSANSSGYPFL